MKFFTSVNKANAELSAAEATLQPILEKAAVKVAHRDGKEIPIQDATVAEKIAALEAARPTGTALAERAELLESNDVIAKRCEKAESDLALAQTTVGSLTRDKANLEADVTAKTATITSLTAEKLDLTNKLEAAMNQYRAADQCGRAQAADLGKLAVEFGCCKADEAATASFNDNLIAIKGAVTAALTRIGVNPAAVPNAQAGTTTASVSQHALVAQFQAIKDPVARAQFFAKNRSTLFAAMRAVQH